MSDCRMKECRNMYLYTHAHQVARICYRMHKFAHTLIYSLACTRTYNSHLNGKKLISQNLTILLLPKANNSYVSVPPPASPSVSRSCSHSLLFSPISFSPSCYIAIVQTVFVRGCVYLCVFFAWACRLSKQTINNLYVKMQTTSPLQATGTNERHWAQ